MPEEYRRQYETREVAAHARIVGRREAKRVHVELCEGSALPDFGRWMCVVSDDQPGLLSLFSAAITAHSLDILAARAYVRTSDGAINEAVDFFAVRRLKAPISDPLSERDTDAIRSAIDALLRGETTVSRLARHSAQTARPTKLPPTEVYFDDSIPDVLHVETVDRPGLLVVITLAIFKERCSILRSNVATIGGMARDEFQLAELDGRVLSPLRREAILHRVHDAILRAI